MGRNTGRMALYEAISKSRQKQARRQGRQRVVRLRSGWFGRRRQRGSQAEKTSRRRYSLRARPAGRWSADRRAYLLAGTVAVVLVLVVLGGVKLVRLWTTPPAENQPAPAGSGARQTASQGADGSLDGTEAPGRPGLLPVEAGGGQADAGVAGRTPPTVPAGDNVIVIASYGRQRDLEPVRQHFDKNGIATEIVKRGDRFFLVTRQRFVGNPTASTNAGYAVYRRILDVGATYKAPEGYERFGTRPFQDAYGMKTR